MTSANLRFTAGDKATAVDIIRESAQWLIDIGEPLWAIEDIENLPNTPDEFHVMWDAHESIAAMTLKYNDDFIWSDTEMSGFIHKLSVRRKFAGKGFAQMMVDYAKKLCMEKGVKYLRLDCDPHRKGLMELYETCGFMLVKIKSLRHEKYGLLDVAMFEMELPTL